MADLTRIIVRLLAHNTDVSFDNADKEDDKYGDGSEIF